MKHVDLLPTLFKVQDPAHRKRSKKSFGRLGRCSDAGHGHGASGVPAYLDALPPHVSTDRTEG